MPPRKKSPAQLDAEIATALKRPTDTFEHTYKQALLKDAIEAVYDRKGSEDLTIAEACEAVRELLPHANWSRHDVSDKTIVATIKRQIPNWF